MKHKTCFLAIIALLNFVLVVAGQEKPAAKDIEIKTTGVERVVATTVDFQKSLNITFASLTSLGARIEQSRLAADPVGLATAAKELEVAEKVSGKKAAITAVELQKQAIELATIRDSSLELSAVALLVADASAAELQKLATAAKKNEADRLAALNSGEEPKGDFHWMHVHNHHAHPVQVYHNGYHAGHVPAYGTWRTPYYGDRNHFYGSGPSHDFRHTPQGHGHTHWHLHRP